MEPDKQRARPENGFHGVEGMPHFIDFEASSLGTNSYPVQVAWNVDMDVRSRFVNPESILTWQDWDEMAESVHGISRPFLAKHGRRPLEVAMDMNRELAGQIALSDAPTRDACWCRVLFDAAGLKMEFAIGDFWEALATFAPSGMHNTRDAAEWLKQLMDRAKNEAPELREHRADDDVHRLMAIWRLAREGK